jgi:general secretion pathway protein I
MRRAGFTLIEVMIAMAILGLGLTVVLEVISTGTALGHDVHRTTEALLLARWKVNQIQIEGFPALGVREGAFEEPFEDYRWRTEVLPTDEENLRELHLWIEWRDGNAEKDIRLATMLYNYGERRRGLFF